MYIQYLHVDTIATIDERCLVSTTHRGRVYVGLDVH